MIRRLGQYCMKSKILPVNLSACQRETSSRVVTNLSDSGTVPVNDNSFNISVFKFDRFEISELIVEVKSFLDRSKNAVERKYEK